ncbi:MAG: alternative ribosome rescue aminoacyl-tRNA hydrolase ArfB [Ignavibacteria bacterium]|nr:alternative ribosome rescue aminoacyl-tRNA hydrolase ArfB [Ignavibacteria bacterium]
MTTVPKGISIQEGLEIPLSEVRFRFMRSGGPGGQHVNKVETAVSLSFNVRTSESLGDRQRQRLIARLGNRIDRRGVLRLVERGGRSQHRNKEHLAERFAFLLREALAPEKKRRPTAPSRGSKEARIRAKRVRSRIKASRKPPPGIEE